MDELLKAIEETKEELKQTTDPEDRAFLEVYLQCLEADLAIEEKAPETSVGLE